VIISVHHLVRVGVNFINAYYLHNSQSLFHGTSISRVFCTKANGMLDTSVLVSSLAFGDNHKLSRVQSVKPTSHFKGSVDHTRSSTETVASMYFINYSLYHCQYCY
jgi:hypothetical protein